MGSPQSELDGDDGAPSKQRFSNCEACLPRGEQESWGRWGGGQKGGVKPRFAYSVKSKHTLGYTDT